MTTQTTPSEPAREKTGIPKNPGRRDLGLNATLVFPNDPARRLVVLWQDEARRARPAAIIVRDDSSWIGPGGVRLGSELP